MISGAIGFLKSLGWQQWIGGAVTSCIAVLLPSEFVLTLVLSTLTLVILDTITGVMAARKKGQKIKSSKFGRLAEKLLGVSVLWVTLALLGNVLGVMLGSAKLGEFLISLGVGAVFVKEGISILENLMRIGVYVPKRLKAKLIDWLGELEEGGAQ